jgi:hypothetical protein
MRPALDKVMLEAWQAAQEGELIKFRTSQLNACASSLEEAFVAAERVAATINAFNRISILSRHPVRPRDSAGMVVR